LLGSFSSRSTFPRNDKFAKGIAWISSKDHQTYSKYAGKALQGSAIWRHSNISTF
jgi:hypothetical protein